MALPHPLPANDSRSDDPLVGKVLDDRYRIVAPLGAGGMGQVYRAVQVGLDRPVALKVLPVGLSDRRDLSFVKRFCLEASITARLAHPNTVTLHDYGRTDEGIFFIAMEYLEGRTLAQLIEEEGAQPAPRLLQLATQIARGVREAHRHGLVHRDLKPSNVMLVEREDEPDLVKVLDFGLARFLSGGEAELSQTGSFLGSPQYMAPELVQGEAATRQSDVYGLGVILYELACGRPPYIAESSVAVLLEHARAEPKRPRLIDPTIPEALEQVILRAMQKDPAQRYASMDELVDALSWASSALGMPPVEDAFQPLLSAADVEALQVGARRRYWRRKLGPWILGALAAGGALFGILQL